MRRFSLKDRLGAFKHADRGIELFFRDTHNSWIQVFVAIAIVALGIDLGISSFEWAIIALAIGGVICAEAVNSAIETCVDLASPNHHDLARNAKDIAAAAVLLASICAIAVGIAIFGPRINDALMMRGEYAPYSAVAPSLVHESSAYMGDPNKSIALTFDDGPYGTSTDSVLATLEAERVPATFFIIGKNAEIYPEEVAREVRDGDVVGNHTYDHSRLLPYMSASALYDDVVRAENIISLAGGVRPRYFRPPYGATSPTMLAEVRREGFSVAMWDIDPEDWNDSVSSSTIVESVVSRAKPGSVILLHDGHEFGGYDRSNTAEALPAIISALKKQGYRFVTVDKLIPPGSGDGAILK